MSTDIFFNPIWDVRITDTSLRDGSHHKRHQFTKDEVGAIVAALDTAGVPVIEVTHGDGLGGSIVQLRLLQDPRAGTDQARRRDRQRGQDRLPDAARRGHQGGHQGGAGQRRVDLPHRHPLHRGRRLDPALRAGPRARPGNRRVPDDGATPSRRRSWPRRPASWPTPAASASTSSTRPARWFSKASPTGWRRWSPNWATMPRSASTATRTSGSGVANSVEAVRAGAKQIDGSCRRFGAGAGNAPVEALIGVFDKIGVKTGIDFFDIADAAEDVVAPGHAGRMPAGPQCVDHGLLGRLLELPQARHPPVRALRRAGPRAVAPGRAAQTDRRSGRPAHRHRAGDQARARRAGGRGKALDRHLHRLRKDAASSLVARSEQ